MTFLRKTGFVLFLLTVFGAIFFCSKQQETVSSPQSVEKEELPVQEGRKSTLYLTKAGKKQAVLQYGHMQQFDLKKIIYFDQGIEVDFYNTEGFHTSHLTADEGEYHEGKEDVLGYGNVVVVSDSGVTLFTEELRWDSKLEKIFSDTLITIVTATQDTIYGVGFESNADLTRRVIKKPWGVSHEKVNFDAIEDSFSKSSKDSVSQDTTKTGISGKNTI